MAHQSRHQRACEAFAIMIFPLITTYLALENRSMLYVVVCRPQCLNCSVSLAEQGSIIIIGGPTGDLPECIEVARRKFIESIGDTSVVSSCATLSATINLSWVSNWTIKNVDVAGVIWLTGDQYKHDTGLSTVTALRWMEGQNKLIFQK